MDRAKAMNKIMLLENLADGTSSEHEASSARRSAQSLRDKFGIPEEESREYANSQNHSNRRSGTYAGSMDDLFNVVFPDIFQGA